MQVELVDPAALVPAAYNPRKISKAQAEALKRSLDRWGFVEPIVANRRTGRIVGGHQRLDGALALAMPKVPVHWVDLDEHGEKALNIALNKISGDWDEPKLAELLAELERGGQDLQDLGFDADEVQAMIDANAPRPELSGDLDEVPEPPAVPVTQPGDLWLLGDHRLLCGDSTSAEAVGRLMGAEVADLLHADPPYGMGKEAEGVVNDNLYADKLDAFQMTWWKSCRKHLADNAGVYVWGNAKDLWRLWYVGGLARSERLTIRNEIVWNKGCSGHGVRTESLRSYYPTERCLFFMIGEQGFNMNADNYWEGWEPIRAWLAAEKEKSGLSNADCNRICGKQNMTQPAFTKGGFRLISREDYEKLRDACGAVDFKRDYDDLKRDYDVLKRDYDDLKREFYSTRAYFDNTHDNMTDVWSFSRIVGDERHGHATPKPVAMAARAIKSSLPLGGLCLEPFSGSGTTIIAAEREGRRCFAMEISPAYCDVAVARWEKATGRKAERQPAP